MNIYLVISLFFLLISIVLNVIFFFKKRKYKKIASKKMDIPFKSAFEEIEKIKYFIDLLYNLYFDQELAKTVLLKNGYITNKDVENIAANFYKTFRSIYPLEIFNSLDNKFNNNLKDLVFKIILKKLVIEDAKLRIENNQLKTIKKHLETNNK